MEDELLIKPFLQNKAVSRHVRLAGVMLAHWWTPAFLGFLISGLLLSPAYSQTLDRFGGRKDIVCATNAKKWRTEKIGDRWWICTPEGHGLFLQDVEYITLTDGTAQDAVAKKYGSSLTGRKRRCKDCGPGVSTPSGIMRTTF